MSGKTSSAIDKPRKPDVGINLCPDGNQVDLDIEGTTLNVTKTSFNMTIGRFSISLNNKDNKNTNDSSLNEITRTEIRTTTQTAIFVVSEAKQNPLFVVMEEFSTCVTAKLPLSKSIFIIIIMVYDGALIAEGVRRADAHLVDIRSTGQDSFSTLTAQDNSLFLAVDSDGDVKVLNRNDNNEDGNGNQVI